MRLADPTFRSRYAPPATGPTAERLRVLLIEDDAEDAELAVEALSSIPWFRSDVAISTTYQHGLAALRGGAYDVVLLDHRLGPDTGLELLHDAFRGSVQVPVVLLTGAVDHAMDEAATAAGVSYLLEKSELSGARLERSIRYALERARIERELRRTRAFFRAAFGSLSDHVAILDERGTIVAVNEPWMRFAAANQLTHDAAALGMNYLDVCESAAGPSAEGAADVARAIRDVLLGTRQSFTHEYPCHAPGEERWFMLKVSRFEDDGASRVLVAHENITERRAAEAALRTSEERHRLVTMAMRELVWELDVASGRVVRSGAIQTLLGQSSPMDGTTRWWQARIHPDDQAAVAASLAAAFAGAGDSWQAEYRFARADGTYAYVADQGHIVRDLLGKAVRVVGATADITERKEAEIALRASERRYRSLIETAHEGICTLDGAGFITYANPRLAAMLGYAPEELAGRSLFDFVHEPHQFDARTRFARRYRGISETDDIQFRRKDGETPWLLASWSGLVDAHGQFPGVLVVLSDITAGKQAEMAMAQALRAADLDRRRLEATLNAIPVGVVLADATGGLTHSNPAAEHIWGGPAPQVGGIEEYGIYKAWWPTTGLPIMPQDWALARTLASGHTITNELVEIQRFDGTRGFVLNSAAPIRDAESRITGGVVINVDVTERQAEARERERLVAALEVERAGLEAIFQHAPSFVAVFRGPDHVLERVNPAFQRLVGKRDLIGRAALDAMPELAEQGFVTLLDRVRETGEPFVGREVAAQVVRGPAAEPSRGYFDVVFLRLAQADGDHALVAHGVNVTEQVLAREKIRRNEQRLSDQFAKLPVPTFLWERLGHDFVLLECNEAARRAPPALGDEHVGKAHSEIFPDREDIREQFRRSLHENVVVRLSLELDLGPQTGRRLFELTIGPQQPDRLLVHVVDTTERSELESQLRQAQKMDAVGRLAGGVAHDFNNLLTVIGAHSSFLLESLDPNDSRREDAEVILKTGVRAAGLTRQLLAFSRKQILKPRVINLNTTVEETLTMLDRLLGEDIAVAAGLASDLRPVVADPGQIDQVLINLAVNARDAMPEGGVLTISTRTVEIEARRQGATRLIPPGTYVLLSVADTGVGMNAAVQARLFEPFFTTKEPGRGTGLGLATVYGIVKQSGGYVLVESAPGAGATFDVYLPAATTEDAGDRLLEAERAVAHGVETILLVEDEPTVRRVAKQMLRRQGYVVLEAGNGQEALAVSAAFDAAIHLVISDAVMPGMGGAEVVRRLQEQRPAMKALFMSGYTDDEVVRRGIVSSRVSFVQKPFTSDALTRGVREALDG